jgi:hypothetical protein
MKIAAVALMLFVASPAGAAMTRPPLRVKVKQCSSGDSPAERSAVFEASLPREVQAATMALRFRLYQSVDGATFTRVAVPGFSAWTRSAPNVAGLVFDKRVNQLVAPAVYRVVVDFVWYDSDGEAVDRAHRTSKTCREPEPSA